VPDVIVLSDDSKTNVLDQIVKQVLMFGRTLI